MLVGNRRGPGYRGMAEDWLWVVWLPPVLLVYRAKIVVWTLMVIFSGEVEVTGVDLVIREDMGLVKDLDMREERGVAWPMLAKVDDGVLMVGGVITTVGGVMEVMGPIVESKGVSVV